MLSPLYIYIYRIIEKEKVKITREYNIRLFIFSISRLNQNCTISNCNSCILKTSTRDILLESSNEPSGFSILLCFFSFFFY